MIRIGEKEAREILGRYKELDPGFDRNEDITLLLIWILQKEMGLNGVRWGMILDIDKVAGWDLTRSRATMNNLNNAGYVENKRVKTEWHITTKGVEYLKEQGVELRETIH